MQPLALALLAVAARPAAPASEYFPPPDARGGWRTPGDAAKVRALAGLDVARLDEAFQFAAQTSQHGGLLVVRHGWLAYERYFGRGAREATPELASCGKAFTSIAVGIAIDDKRALIPHGLDEKVFTPRYMPAEIFPLDDPRKADITLGQLLAMSAGIRGTSPGWVNGVKVEIPQPAKDGPIATTDEVALHQSLWCDPGAGYSYATSSPHLASIVLRRLVGMEMQEYMQRKLAGPMGWGRWGYALHRPNLKMDHTPGGGSIALRSTDVLRFAYLLLHEGRWGKRQLAPAAYVRACGKLSPYNPHYPHSLEFVVNEGGQVTGVPRDAYWKAGAGGYSIYVVPSMDMVVYKMGGNEGQYDPALTGLPVRYQYDGSRADWKQPPGIKDATEQTLRLVVAAATDTRADRVGFPKDYQRWAVVRTVDKAKEQRRVTIYANDAAAGVARLDQLPYPDDAVLVMETAAAEKDAKGNPLRDEQGQFRKGAVVGLHVMRRGPGFGEAYGRDRAGPWEFVEYGPDGRFLTAPERSGACAACHVKAGAARDFVFRGRFP